MYSPVELEPQDHAAAAVVDHQQYDVPLDGHDVKDALCGGGGGGEDTIDNVQLVAFDEGDVIGGLDGIEVSVPHDSVYGGVFPEGGMMPRGGDVSNQLTLSFRGQVYVFDAVTADKVQEVLLLLGGCEYTPGHNSVEMPYQNPRGFPDYNGRCNDPKRVESLNRFRQKRKERCFEKKIRYNVRQEVALKMQRKKGQFAPRSAEDSMICGSVEEPGQNDNPPETLCTHCGTGSKSTPMMRKGPAGPRTLCNACGLFWANKGTLRSLSKKAVAVTGEDDVESDSDFGTPPTGSQNSLTAFSASSNSAIQAQP